MKKFLNGGFLYGEKRINHSWGMDGLLRAVDRNGKRLSFIRSERET